MPKRDNLFVYGTLRKKNSTSARVFLTQHFDFVGKTTFRGKLYDLGGYPGAVPSDKPSDVILGKLHRLPRTTERHGCGCRKECSGLRRRAVPQSHRRKSVVRGLHDSNKVSGVSINKRAVGQHTSPRQNFVARELWFFSRAAKRQRHGFTFITAPQTIRTISLHIMSPAFQGYLPAGPLF